jgi:hypothetical protein
MENCGPNPLDNPVFLYELATGEVRREYPGHRAPVRSLAFSPSGKILATGSADGTALLWDVLAVHPSDEGGLEFHWDALAGEYAIQAYNSACALARAPHQAVRILSRKLRPIPPIARTQIDRWLADLDSPRYVVRQQAMKQLERHGELCGPALRALRESKPSLEVRNRVDRVLAKLKEQAESSERFRPVRAVEVLEHIGTVEARQLLQTLADGAPEARLTREAKASLRRLRR